MVSTVIVLEGRAWFLGSKTEAGCAGHTRMLLMHPNVLGKQPLIVGTILPCRHGSAGRILPSTGNLCYPHRRTATSNLTRCWVFAWFSILLSQHFIPSSGSYHWQGCLGICRATHSTGWARSMSTVQVGHEPSRRADTWACGHDKWSTQSMQSRLYSAAGSATAQAWQLQDDLLAFKKLSSWGDAWASKSPVSNSHAN